MEDADYDAALAIFEKLGDYEDCAEQIQRVHYLKAEALYDEADYAGALDEFEAAGDYEDAASRITETTYQLGVQQLENGGQWYQTMGQEYGNPFEGSGDWCMKLCLLNAFCSCCCGGRAMPIFCC